MGDRVVTSRRRVTVGRSRGVVYTFGNRRNGGAGGSGGSGGSGG